MKLVRGIVSVVAALALAVAFVAAGFAACLAPQSTTALSGLFADDATSPFGKAQLVHVAEATRDYSFASHDELALYQAIYQVNREHLDGESAIGATVGRGFPVLDAVRNQNDLSQLKAAFANASELYCFSGDTVAHLDDCYAIARVAYPALIAVAILAAAGLVFAGATSGRRRVGGVLLAAGTIVLVSFVALGAWAAVDFTGFFTMFHRILFSQGNWTFPYDSLLICALPQAFWAGMGALWLLVTALLSLASIAVGRRILRRRPRRRTASAPAATATTASAREGE